MRTCLKGFGQDTTLNSVSHQEQATLLVYEIAATR
jgi:hypothetical protein